LTSNVRVTGSACGGDLPHASNRRYRGIVGQADLYARFARSRPQRLTGHIEHGVAAALRGNPDDHLPRLDHFAGLGGCGDHDAAGIGLELGIADLVLGDLQLRLRGVELGPRSIPALLRPLILDARRSVTPQQEFLALVIALGLGELCLRSHNGSLSRAQRVELVLRFEFRDYLARFHPIPDIDGPFDHSSANTKRQSGLDLGLDAPSERDSFAEFTLLYRYGTDRTNLGRRCCVLALAAGKEEPR
jgi:hypothetical protein